MEALQVREVVTAGLDEQLVQAVDKAAVVTYIQVRAEGGTNEFSFPAGNAEAAGSALGGGCLSYFVRHATQEIFTISTVADDVLQSAGEFENAGLERHDKKLLINIRERIEGGSGGRIC